MCRARSLFPPMGIIVILSKVAAWGQWGCLVGTHLEVVPHTHTHNLQTQQLITVLKALCNKHCPELSLLMFPIGLALYIEPQGGCRGHWTNHPRLQHLWKAARRDGWSQTHHCKLEECKAGSSKNSRESSRGSTWACYPLQLRPASSDQLTACVSESLTFLQVITEVAIVTAACRPKGSITSSYWRTNFCWGVPIWIQPIKTTSFFFLPHYKPLMSHAFLIYSFLY